MATMTIIDQSKVARRGFVIRSGARPEGAGTGGRILIGHGTRHKQRAGMGGMPAIVDPRPGLIVINTSALGRA
jgi:hypothetical protein